MKTLWNEFKGYKTYVVAVAAIIYGVYAGSAEIVLLGLGLAGVRNGLTTEVAKAVTSKNPVQAVEQVAAQEAATEVAQEAK